MLDEVGDGDHLDAVPLAVDDEVGHAGHRAVVVHDLAHDPGGIQACEPSEVDSRFGLAGPLQDAAGLRAQREDVSRLHEVVWHRARVDRHLDRLRAIVRRDPRRDALPGLDRHRERRAQRGLVVVGHRAKLELVAALGGETEADEPAPMRGHESDRLRRDELCREGEIALVLPVGVVDDDNEAPRADVLDCLLDRRERGGRLGRSQIRGHARIVALTAR